jgi:hypothetical protein
MKKEMIEFARNCMMELVSKENPIDGIKTIDALNMVKINKILNEFETEPLSREPMTRSPFETENCSLCGKDTHVLKSQDINNRAFYVEGAGQLCETCYNKIYGPRITNP